MGPTGSGKKVEEEKLQQIEEKLQQMEEKLQQIEEKLQQIEEKPQQIEEKPQQIEEKLRQVEEKLRRQAEEEERKQCWLEERSTEERSWDEAYERQYTQKVANLRTADRIRRIVDEDTLLKGRPRPERRASDSALPDPPPPWTPPAGNGGQF